MRLPRANHGQFVSSNTTTAWGYDLLVNQSLSNIWTFTRASSAWSYNSSGVLVSNTSNTPRFDYDPVSFLPNGFLIEEARTNLLTNSDSMATGGQVTYATDSPNVMLAPDGTMAADGLVEDGSTNQQHYVERNSISRSAGVATFTASIFCKIGSRGFARLAVGDSTFASAVVAYFDLNAGVAITPVNYSGGWTGSSAIRRVSNGFYRCSITFTTDASTTGTRFRVGAAPDGVTTTYNGSSGSTAIYHWGCQLEAAPFVTTYIPTAASQVTRAADNATITDLTKINFNQSAGTIYAEFVLPRFAAGAGGDNLPGVITICDSALNNYYCIGANAAGQAVYYRKGAASPAALNTTNAFAAGTVARVAVAYGPGQNDAICLNGGAVANATAGAPTGMTELRIGRFAGNPSWLNGWLRNVRYIPRRMTDTELQSLTTLYSGPTLTFDFKAQSYNLEHI